jgi:hypothetical protein
MRPARACPGGIYAASNAEIVPTLGRNLAACGNAVPCDAQVLVSLLGAYTGGFEARLTQVDVRVTKQVGLGGVRVRGMFDIYNLFNANTILGWYLSAGHQVTQTMTAADDAAAAW